MSTTVKVTLQGNTRDIQLSALPTIGGLRTAVVSAFDVETTVGNSRSVELCFTYIDDDGDDITFDRDSELDLALQMCQNILEVKASIAGAKLEVRQQ